MTSRTSNHPSQCAAPIARQAEADRDRRAKVIHAKDESESADPGRRGRPSRRPPRRPPPADPVHHAEISAERNCTLIFPLPMEILRLVVMLRQPQEKAGAAPLTQAPR